MAKHTFLFKDIGVTLVRMYTGHSPDQVGSLAEWRAEIDEIRVNYTGREPFNGLTIRVCHPDAPETSADTWLLRYKAAGLKYHNKELVDILYRESYGRDAIIRILSHELFHWIAAESGLNRETPWGELCLDWFVNNAPDEQASNEQELFAEVGASIGGTDEFIGRFSDGRVYKAPASMVAFVKGVYIASLHSNEDLVDDVLVDGGGLMWRETKPGPWFWPFPIVSWHRVTPEGRKQIYIKGRWS